LLFFNAFILLYIRVWFTRVGRATVLRNYIHTGEKIESLEQNTNVLFGCSHAVILFLSLPVRKKDSIHLFI